MESDSYHHRWLLDRIEDMKSGGKNKGMILFVNTPGGSVYASDEMYLAIQDYRKKTGRPVYSYMASQATSGGYYISAPCDRIVANRNCWTGSIGVTMLENIKEYSLIGDLFHIYGQDKKKKTVLLDEAGIYTVTIYAEGYSVISTKVEVAQGDAVPANAADASLTEHNTDYDIDALIKSSAIDTISGATGSARRRSNSSGGGISSGTEALVNPVNGYYLFNHDLLINALISVDRKSVV